MLLIYKYVTFPLSLLALLMVRTVGAFCCGVPSAARSQKGGAPAAIQRRPNSCSR